MRRTAIRVILTALALAAVACTNPTGPTKADAPEIIQGGAH